MIKWIKGHLKVLDSVRLAAEVSGCNLSSGRSLLKVKKKALDSISSVSNQNTSPLKMSWAEQRWFWSSDILRYINTSFSNLSHASVQGPCLSGEVISFLQIRCCHCFSLLFCHFLVSTALLSSLEASRNSVRWLFTRTHNYLRFDRGARLWHVVCHRTERWVGVEATLCKKKEKKEEAPLKAQHNRSIEISCRCAECCSVSCRVSLNCW